MQRKRVVITGMGVVSPLGCDLEKFWTRICSGVSGIGPIQKFDASGYACRIAGEVADFNIDSFIPIREQKKLDAYSQFAVAAADIAVQHSGIQFNRSNPARCGAIIGSGIGGLHTLEIAYEKLLNKGPSSTSPFMIPRMIPNIAAGLIAIRHNLKGPNFGTVSACSSSAHAIVDACRIIRSNEADLMVAGGAEAPICPIGIDGFCGMRALSTRNDSPQAASRPFDKDRDGFVMSEGAAVLILEELAHARNRGATIYAEVAGYGITCDAYHITMPADDGNGAICAMRLAMEDAALNPKQIDYINAHGTSTYLNDKIESKAIKALFGESLVKKLMVSSTKSMTGHMIGAAGSIETVICSLAIRDGVVPPTINYETRDPDCDLDYVPNISRSVKISACLTNSFAFGGQNVCLALKKF